MSEYIYNIPSAETFLSKICNYILESTKRLDTDQYSPYVDLLRRLFVPSIDHRVNALLGHFVYNNESTCEEIFDPSWLEVSCKLNRLLKIEGVCGVAVDSILLGNRLDKIGRELDRLGFETPSFHQLDLLSDVCENYGSAGYWINRFQTTLTCNPASITNGNTTARYPRESRKRKACEEEVSTSSYESINTTRIETNPFDVISEDFRKDQTRTNVRRVSVGTKRDRIETSRNDKLRIVVTDDCSRRRIDYLKIPCDSKALGEKVFKNSNKSCCTLKSGKLDERLQNVCVCLNNVVNRLDNDEINESSLSCDIRKNYVRFKLGCMKSKVCMFATRVAIEEQRKKKENVSQERCKNPCSLGIGKCECGKSDNTKDKLSSVGENVTACSTRFLWENSDGKLSSSSIGTIDSENADIFSSTRNDQDSYSYVCPRHCKSKNKSDDGKSIGCKTPNSETRRNSCSCNHNKIIYDFDSEKINEDSKPSKSKSNLKQKKCQDVGLMTENTENRCCRKKELTWKDAETITDEIEDPIELTNIYINEISMCYRDDENQALNGVNTDCMKKYSMDMKLCSNIATNTVNSRLKEISTQVFFKEIQFCTCYKNVADEFEIEDVRFDNPEFDHTCKCNKETSTDEKFIVLDVENDVPKKYTCQNETPFEEIIRKLRDPACKSSEFTRAMKSKINEIVELNEKIREKFMTIKKNKSLCTVSVQTITKKESRDNLKIEMKTSVISLKSSVNKDKCSRKPSQPKNIRCGEIKKSAKNCDTTVSGMNKNHKNETKCEVTKKSTNCCSKKMSYPKLIKCEGIKVNVMNCTRKCNDNLSRLNNGDSNNTKCEKTKRTISNCATEFNHPKNIRCEQIEKNTTNFAYEYPNSTKYEERKEITVNCSRKPSHMKNIKCEEMKKLSNCIRTCDNETFCGSKKPPSITKCPETKNCFIPDNDRLQSRSSVVRRSFLFGVSPSSSEEPSKPCDNINKEPSIDFHMTKSSHYTSRWTRGDAPDIIEILTRSEMSNCSHSTHHTCRCTKKSNFLHFLSDHLTRESLEKLRRILNGIVHKILEKGKEMYELRKKRTKCCCEKYEFRGCRLAAGCDRPMEFTSKKNRSRYPRKRSKGQFLRRMKAEESSDCGDRLRRCRTEIFVPKNLCYK